MTATTRDLLSEAYIQDAFHSYLKSSLTQAKAEHLLDADILSSAEGDLMITGPALCLYFAALRCTTNPPSVPLPRKEKSGGAPVDLSYENCPTPFIPFLRVWSLAVPQIQALTPELQHDLARMICGLNPLITPLQPGLNGIAADLRAVAIEISQRRSFQSRYADDLQAALDAGTAPATPSPKRAAFVPPPEYVEASPVSSAHSSPRSSMDGHASGDGRAQYMTVPDSLRAGRPSNLLSPPGSSATTRPRSHSPATHSPTILSPTSPAIEFIRETLYASLGDAIEQRPTVAGLIKTDPPRAYFAAVSFAILEIATSGVGSDGTIRGVLGRTLTMADCPRELRPFMAELASIGAAAREMRESDDVAAVEAVSHGKRISEGKMARVAQILEGGIGHSFAGRESRSSNEGRRSEDGRRSVEGRAVSFANRVNALSLGMTRLKAFRDRQEEVFAVLSSLGS